MIDQTNTALSFGEFQIDADRRLLLRKGEVVPLKAKALDVLLTLVERRGEIVSKNELLDKVWENQFVEENNLTVHVAALRKALGEKKNENRYIVTVPGKGYRFVGEIVGSANRQAVIESRTFQKLVVSEEFEEISEDDGYGDVTTSAYQSSVPSTKGNVRFPILTRSALVITGFAVLAAIAAYGLSLGSFSNLFGDITPFKNHEVIQLTTNGKVGNAALSPDGKQFAYVIDDLGSKSLWVGKVAGGNHLQLRPPVEGTYNALAFSPDGDQLYFSIRDEKNPASAIYKIPSPGGVATKVVDGVGYFALSPDGKTLARGRRDNERDVIVVSRIDGTESVDVVSFARRESFLFDSISWSPDGSRLGVSVTVPGNTEKQELGIIDLATRSDRATSVTQLSPGDEDVVGSRRFRVDTHGD